MTQEEENAMAFQLESFRDGLAQAKQYIDHDRIAHCMRKKEDGEYELSFDPACRRCGWENLFVIFPKDPGRREAAEAGRAAWLKEHKS